MITFLISQIFIFIAIFLIFLMLENDRKITDIQNEMLSKLAKLYYLQNKISNWQDTEISQIQKKLEFLEAKQIEMRKNICLQNRRIDKIFLEKVSNDDFLESLRLISNDFESAAEWETEFEKKFALEMEDFRKTFERITKNHYKKIRNLEKSPPNISETENIF